MIIIFLTDSSFDCQKFMKNAHHKFPEPRVTCSNLLILSYQQFETQKYFFYNYIKQNTKIDKFRLLLAKQKNL